MEDTSNVLLLDIREKDELEDGKTIEGSTNMPMGKVFTEVAKNNLSKDKKIIVFCKSGFRAGIVVQILKEKGYDIEGLDGGLNDLYSK